MPDGDGPLGVARARGTARRVRRGDRGRGHATPTSRRCAGCCTSSPATTRWHERASTSTTRRPRSSGDPDDTELLRRKGAEFLKAYRDRGAGEISIGDEDRLPTSLRLASTFELADEDMELWIEELATRPVGSRARLEDAAAAGAARGVQRHRHRRRARRPQRGDPAEARRHPLHRRREEPRRRRHVVGEPVSRLSRRHREPFLHEPVRRRLELPVLALPGVRERALLPVGHRHVRAARRHRVRHRGASRWRGTRTRASGR